MMNNVVFFVPLAFYYYFIYLRGHCKTFLFWIYQEHKQHNKAFIFTVLSVKFHALNSFLFSEDSLMSHRILCPASAGFSYWSSFSQFI